MGAWTITALFVEWQFGQKEWFPNAAGPGWASEPVGGVVVAQLSPNEFALNGDHVRVSFAGPQGGPANGIMIRAEDGHFGDGCWVTERVWILALHFCQTRSIVRELKQYT